MKTFLLFMLLTVLGPVELDKTVHDFGEISIKDGPQTCEFVVTNISEEPVHILSVVSSYGCTSVKWTREAIAPGESGKISIEYANDEPDAVFNKSITAYISDKEKPFVVQLHLRGKTTNKKKK